MLNKPMLKHLARRAARITSVESRTKPRRKEMTAEEIRALPFNPPDFSDLPDPEAPSEGDR